MPANQKEIMNNKNYNNSSNVQICTDYYNAVLQEMGLFLQFYLFNYFNLRILSPPTCCGSSVTHTVCTDALRTGPIGPLLDRVFEDAQKYDDEKIDLDQRLRTHSLFRPTALYE